MKHYQRVFVIPCLMILVLTLFSGFAPAGVKNPVETLLNQRTSILQQAFYGQIQQEEAEKRLAQVETQPLLAADVNRLRSFEASQLDLVKKMDILQMRQSTKVYDYLTYDVQIRWEMKGLSGDYTQVTDYFVVLKQTGGEYRLSEFSPKE